MLIGETLAHQARVQPDREALIVGERRLTWRQLNEGANRAANMLTALGARHGDRVLLVLNNSVEFVEIYYGLAKIGCISAPIMPRSLASDVAFIAQNLRAKFAIVEADSANLIREIDLGLETVESIVGIGAGHGLPLDYHALHGAASPAEPVADVKPDDYLTLKFTSGTTGVPKGCIRSHRNFIMAASVALIEIPLFPEDSAIVANPLAAGMAVSQMTMLVLKGIRSVMMPRFEPAEYLQLVGRERPTLAYLMDTMVRRMFPLPEFERTDLSCIRLYHGAGNLEVIKTLREHPTFRAGFTFGFASSEAGGLVTFKKPEIYERALNDPASAHLLESVGTEAPLSNVECLDDDLKPVPTGEMGELAVRGPSVFQGYWERPEETAKTLRDGWLLTGDLGVKDAEGHLYIRGRKRDMIKSGGINVYPAEIEPVILSHTKVSEVVVVGVPDREWGERVVACVVAKEPCTQEEIIEYCRDKLASYKRPKTVAFFDSFPLSNAGKLSKKDLVKILLENAPGENTKRT